jgi:hypothetical protein
MAGVAAVSDWRRRHHEVSILIVAEAGVGRCLGWPPRAKVSMMNMRPPQQGQGCASGCAAAASISTAASAAGVASPRSSRARAIVSARFALANRP